jgi:hypothetical protein
MYLSLTWPGQRGPKGRAALLPRTLLMGPIEMEHIQMLSIEKQKAAHHEVDKNSRLGVEVRRTQQNRDQVASNS